MEIQQIPDREKIFEMLGFKVMEKGIESVMKFAPK